MLRLTLPIALILVLAGCGGGEPEEPAEPADQPAAKAKAKTDKTDKTSAPAEPPLAERPVDALRQLLRRGQQLDAVVEALKGRPGDATTLVGELLAGNPGERRRGVDVAGKLGEVGVPAMTEAVASRNSRLRRLAVEHLHAHKEHVDRAAIPALAAAAAARDPKLQRKAYDILIGFGEHAAKELAAAFLDPNSQGQVIYAFHQRGEGGLLTLAAVAEAGGPALAPHLWTIVEKVGPRHPDAVRTLAVIAKGENGEIAAKARAIVFSGEASDAANDLVAQLKSASSADKPIILRKLADEPRIPGDAAQEIAALLRHDDGMVRAVAARALAKVQPAYPAAALTLVDMLRKAEGEEAADERAAATAALSAIGRPAAPVLLETAVGLPRGPELDRVLAGVDALARPFMAHMADTKLAQNVQFQRGIALCYERLGPQAAGDLKRIETYLVAQLKRDNPRLPPEASTLDADLVAAMLQLTPQGPARLLAILESDAFATHRFQALVRHVGSAAAVTPKLFAHALDTGRGVEDQATLEARFGPIIERQHWPAPLVDILLEKVKDEAMRPLARRCLQTVSAAGDETQQARAKAALDND